MSKYAYIDFEYNQSSEKILNLVCCSILVDDCTHNFWLHKDDDAKLRLFQFINNLNDDGYIFVSYAAEAEASSVFSLGINPTKLKWVDLHLEVKMLYNHNYELSTGKHLSKGKEVVLRPFGDKPQTNLASSLYKFCNLKIDTQHKTEMRDLIISQPEQFTMDEEKAILDYCASDVKHLPMLKDKIFEALSRYIPKIHLKTLYAEILNRGDYSARTALMVRHGTPINLEWAKNLASNVPIALIECIQDINSQFEIKPFRFDKRESKYVMNTKVLRDWIKEQNFKTWKLTEGGASKKREYSLALEAWEDHFQFRHDFPRNNLGAQMVRYLKLKQSLNSFNFKENQKESTFFDYLGSDGYSRAYMNHFGAQSSRTQPKSSGFLFLKSAWMRSICQPPEGYAIGGIDYSSQEFLLSAVCSKDPKMIQAYKDGDVYLYYGKGIGLIPPDGTKKTHGAERDLCKATVLGLSYLMTKVGLSKKLTADTGRYVSEEEAEKLVDSYDRLFSVFSDWRNTVIEHYQVAGYLRLPDGWFMFKDNPSFRSSANMPLQGAGAAIMRKAVALAQDAGLNIIFTLHDALYIMAKSDQIADSMDTLKDCMIKAFCHFFEGKSKEDAALIRVDGKIWGPEINDGQVVTNTGFVLESSKYHIDKRSQSEYDIFSKYFFDSPKLDIL